MPNLMKIQASVVCHLCIKMISVYDLSFFSFEIICLVFVLAAILTFIFREALRYYGSYIGVKPTPQFANPAFRGYYIDPPETWHYKYPLAKACNQQSPINISTTQCKVVPYTKCGLLMFSPQYYSVPCYIKLINDGYGGAHYDSELPHIEGGPLMDKYRLNFGMFKWGPNFNEGSEHTIDFKRYALELELVHVKGENVYHSLESAVREHSVVIVSYLFELTRNENPYMQLVCDALNCIKTPQSTTVIMPFPLCWLFHPFNSKYYYYPGSITCPPCTEGVDWIIQPEPLAVSTKQLDAFRSLSAIDGPMTSNTRYVQKINNRRVVYYE